MSIDQFLADYGYLAVALGCFLEGETMLVLGGFAAHRGYLDPTAVMLAGFVGGLTGDQLYFYLGRRHGKQMLARRPRWQALAARIETRLGLHRDLFILGFRFLYGLRVVSPLVIGLTSVSPVRYTVLNVVGGTVWAVSITMLGYLFGRSVEGFLQRFQACELQLFGAIAALVVVVWTVRWLVARQTTRALPRDQA